MRLPLLLGLLPATAHAQAAAPQGPSLMPLLLALALVLALIPLATWVLKRFSGALPGQAAGMRVVAQLSLGPRERIVVVEAGSRWLLLGVTAGSITRVGSLPKGELPLPHGTTAFASLLHAARGKSTPDAR